MDPNDDVAETAYDDAEVLEAIRAAANGALDYHFLEGDESEPALSPLQWEGVSWHAASGRVHALELEGGDENGLTVLAADIGRLTALRSLTFTYCSILTELPPYELNRCVALQVLDLRGCKSLSTLPSELSGCVALRLLDLRGCSMLTLSGFALQSLPRQCAVMLHNGTHIAATAGAPRLSAEQADVLRAMCGRDVAGSWTVFGARPTTTQAQGMESA